MGNEGQLRSATGVIEETVEVIFSRTQSIAEVIQGFVRVTQSSIDAALYRFNSRQLAHTLDEARRWGVRLRLLIDRNKYQESAASQELLSGGKFPFRLSYGRDGVGSKMHHKFVVLDSRTVLTGSYNWTFASEQRNHEHLLIVREPKLIQGYREEFEALWAKAEEAPGSGGPNSG